MKQDEHCPEIMVVDDDPDTLAILVRYIRREGFTAVEASSGTECLSLAKQHLPDVILLDLMMPEMDGFAVCRALKVDSGTAEIPVIMLTARDDVEARAQGMELGVSDFIAKPIVRREVVERIHAQLEMLATDRANFATLDQLSRRNPNGSKKA
ncbi:MAG: response regulator [Deltaproteobacteria bacterium]|nr:response regulator [Deltaproteobacteria bacterium]